jgi:hypothetical protein
MHRAAVAAENISTDQYSDTAMRMMYTEYQLIFIEHKQRQGRREKRGKWIETEKETAANDAR